MARTQKKARRDGYTIVFVDESGFYLLPGLVRTYAPCGQTPVLTVPLTRDHLSVMGGATPTGRWFTLIRDHPLASPQSVQFLKHRLRFLDRALVIWDGASIHKGEVRTFLSEGGAQRLHVEKLPAYAPELNPVEGVWHLLKDVEMRNLCCRDLSHLRAELRLATMRLRMKPRLIRSCFDGAGLPIET